MAKGKGKAVKGAAAKNKKAAKQDAKPVPHQEVSVEQVPSAADAEQHQTATQQAVVGLSNLGNTCFFNSSVQMLLACAPLQQMLLQKDHDITRGPLGFALQQATLHAAGRSSMSKGGSNSTYNPQSLLSAVCCHAPVFKGKQQHDAHELTRMLLDGLQTQEQRYKDLSRRGPSKGLAGLPNGSAALANGHSSKQGDADLSTTSSSSDDSTASSSDSSDSSPSPGGRPTANGYVTQGEDGSASAVSTAMGNGTANGTVSGLNSSSDDSSSTSAGSSSSRVAGADEEDTAASAGDGLDDLCKAYLRKPKSPEPTLDSLADEVDDTSGATNVTSVADVTDTAASGPGTTDVAAADEAGNAAANGGQSDSASPSSSSYAGLPQAPAAEGAVSVEQPAAQAADSVAANASSNGTAACTVCGCSIPPQQQQGAGSNPLQRKSLLPPAPPTSAGSSSVEAVFGGVLSSYITCTACGYCSISYEPFLDLSLPIPLGNGPEQGLIRKGSLLSRLANTARGKKKAAPKDAAADTSVDGSSTAGAPDAAAATAAAEAAAETAAAAAAAAAAAQRKKNLPHKEKRRLQQAAKEAAKEANKLARLAKKKQQEQEDASGSSRADGQQQGPAAVTDPALFEDIPPTNYYTREQVELMATVQALNDSQQQQGSEEGQPQQEQQQEQDGDADAEQQQQQQQLEEPGGAGASAGAEGSPRVSLSRATAASDEGASTVSGWTDLGGANASPPTAAVSCWGGTWGDVQPSRSPAPPGSTSSSHVPPPSSSSGFAPSSSDAGGIPVGGSDGSGTSPTGAPGQQQQAQPGRKTLHRRFASLSNLSTLTSGAKGGLSSLFTGRHSRQGSKDKDALDKLASAALTASANGSTQVAQRSQSAGVTSPSSGRGGLKGLFLNRAATPPPPRPSSALGVVSELGEGQGSGGLAPRNSIPEDGPVVGPVDPVDHGLLQQQQQHLGADGVFTPLGVMPGDLSVSLAGPEGATAGPVVLQQDGSSTAGNGTQPSTAAAAAAAAPAGSGGFLPAVQLATRRLQRAFSDDAVMRLGSMHRSSSSSSGGGSAAGDAQSPAAAGGTAVNGQSTVTSAAAHGSNVEGESAGLALPLAGTYSNPFAAPAVQQQQQQQQALEAADAASAQQQDRPSSTSPAPAAVTDPAAAAVSAAVVPGQDPFAAAAVVAKGDSLAVKHCMATFFLREDVSWECPKEKAAWKERRLSAASGRLSADGGSGAGAGAASGSGGGVCATCSQRQQQGGGGVAIAAAHPRLQQLLEGAEEDEDGPIFKQVSFSDRQPQVHFVPGSVEQRGTDLSAALAGRRPFCRALTWGGASLLLTAQLGETFLEGAAAGRQLRLGLKAAGEGGVANAPAARVLPGGREVHLGAVRLPDVQKLHLSGDDSSALLQHWAQLVLNCMADLVHCEGGITGLQAMAAGGLTILPAEGARHALRPGYVDASSLEGLWKVRGLLPQAAPAAAAGSADSAGAGADAEAGASAAEQDYQQQQQQQEGYWEYPAGDAAEDAAADATEGPAAAGGADADGDSGAANTPDLHSHGSCMSPAGSSSAAASGSSSDAVSNHTSRQASGADTPTPAAADTVDTGAATAAAAADGGEDMFAMDEEEGQCDAGSEQQEQGAHGLSTQGWQGDALSSASSGTLGRRAGSGTKVLRSGSSLGSRDGEDGSSSSTSRSVSLFRKVSLSPAGTGAAPAAGDGASDGSADAEARGGSGSSGAVAISQPPAAAAVSQPVSIKPLQGSPPPGVSLSPAVGSSGGGRTPLGHSGSLRRSSLRRRSSSCCRTAHKSYRIYLPPQVLLLHLKRFQHDGRGRLNKLDTAVKFEFEFDLSPFMAENAPSSSSSSSAAGHTAGGGAGGVDGNSSNGVQAQVPQRQQQQSLMYDLVGLVVHMGTMRGGHYIAYVKRVHGWEPQGQSEAGTGGAGSSSSGGKGRVQWYYVSDTAARAVNVSEVAAAQAYMMLYVRRPAKEQQQQQQQPDAAAGGEGAKLYEGHMHDCGL